MRSKTLSSEMTILKKDLTRFAPVWLGLCAYLTIWATTIITTVRSSAEKRCDSERLMILKPAPVATAPMSSTTPSG